MYNWRTAYLVAALMYLAIIALLLVNRDKLSTQVVVHPADTLAEHSLAFVKLPVVWWCFAFFLRSTMTLTVVQNFSVSI